jgi:hypothetical protein
MSKKYPAAKAVKFVLCEDAREEARRKLSLLGVYPNDSITVYAAEPVPAAGGVAVLQSLTLVAMLRGVAGEFAVSVKVLGPNRKLAFEGKLPELKIDKTASAVVGFKVQGFVVPEFGKYRAELMLDDRVYPYEFEVLNGEAA